MKRTIRLNENEFKNIIKSVLKETKKKINEGQYDEEPIKKWVYWTFNYYNPEDWMDIFQGAPKEHFMKKFNMYNGDMNRFFVELDSTNQQILIDYVMNNY